MVELQGKSVFSGIAIGRISVLEKGDQLVKRHPVQETEEELARFEQARTKAKEQLQRLYEKARSEVGEANAQIFEVHQMMLDDLDYVESIANVIQSQKINAEFAVATVGDNFAQMFQAMDDDYMRERAADVKDVSNRVIRILQGKEKGTVDSEEPVILVAEDLAPSETVQLDKSKVLSFVTHKGSTNSHTAILARTMNIPALIGVELPENLEGKMAIVDGNDLTQYTLAMDRQNPKLESFYDPHHEAILRMIEMTVENGHKHQCWVGICGELGADLSLTETFIHMGIDELSVTPSMVLKVRDTIRKI